MVINDIDFPYEIIRALKDDNLVVFVGAGVSRNEPTRLPDFKGLVVVIGELCGEDYDSADCECDEFLGDLERKGSKIHNYVARELSPEGLQHNRYHENIVNLFNSSESVRIVTTNQDVMLEQAAEACGISAKTYYSPAIPSGSDFHGIVHLHGVVSDPPNIIITDADFGRAYMLNGYATRFLVDMFSKYTVIFIGYSYNDPIVRYLTASIPPEHMPNAYILSEQGDHRTINRTGIKIVEYPEGEHSRACDAIKRLGDYCKRGLFDWEKRIKAIDLRVPPFEKELTDEILDGLSKPAVMKRIIPLIKTREWALWLDHNGLFDELFHESGSLSENSIVWARWLAENCIGTDLFELLLLHNNKINPTFCEIIINSFAKKNEKHSDSLLKKHVVLFRSLRTGSYLHVLLDVLYERGLIEEAWDLFVDYLDYSIILQKGFSLNIEEPIFDYVPQWIVRNELIQHYWDFKFERKVINPLATVTKLTLLIQRLTHDLYVMNDSKGVFSINVLDIEKTISDYNNDELITICEILREALFKLADENLDQTMNWLNMALSNKEQILLRRIGMIALKDNEHIDAEEKVGLVLRYFSLHEYFEKEQIFKLIASIFDCVDISSQECILEKIWNIDDKIAEDSKRNVFYERYNWYEWLDSQCKSCKDKIAEYIEKIHKEYPDFRPRTHPELNFGPIETRWGNVSPLTEEEILSKTSDEFYQYAVDYHGDDFFAGADRYGLMSMITSISSKKYSFAVDLINNLKAEANYTNDIWSAAIRGLSNSINTENDFITVLSIIEAVTDRGLAKDFALLIYDLLSRTEIHNMIMADNYIRTRVISYLFRLWEQRDASKRFKADWPTISLNVTAGIVTHSLIKLSCDIKNRRIDAEFKSFADNPELEAEETPEYACTVSEYSSRIYYADRDWFSSHIINMLESANADTKTAAWEGLLLGVGNISADFAEALLPVFERNKEIRINLDKDYYRRFIHDYVMMFTYLEDDPITKYVNPLLITDDDKYMFAHTLGVLFKRMDTELVKRIWEKWVRAYWRLRLENIPCAITSDELTEMVQWAFAIPDFDEIVNLIISTKVDGLIRAERILFEFSENDIIEKHPNTATKLLSYICNNCDRTVFVMHSVRGIAERIINSGPDVQSREMLEELLY